MTTIADLEQMIGRIALGDRKAFAALYAATSAKLFGQALRVLNNRAEAEDALQEVYVKVWNAADRYQVNGLSPMTWLITIMRNHAIDKLRARRGTTGDMDEAAEIADASPGPEAQLIAKSEAGRIAGCLATLDPDKADAVRRAYMEGETYVELAAEYALGLLDRTEARAFEGRMAQDPALRAAYVIWAEDLARLTDGIAPVEPPAQLYKTLDQRLFGQEKQGWLQWIGLVPALIGGLAAATLVYFVTSFGLLTTPPGPRLNAEITATDQSLVVLAAFDPTTGALNLQRTNGAAVPGRVLELWLIAGDNPPVSLGVLPDAAVTDLPLTPAVIAALEGGTLAISDEPLGGSPTGAPTGAVLAIGPVITS